MARVCGIQILLVILIGFISGIASASDDAMITILNGRWEKSGDHVVLHRPNKSPANFSKKTLETAFENIKSRRDIYATEEAYLDHLRHITMGFDCLSGLSQRESATSEIGRYQITGEWRLDTATGHVEKIADFYKKQEAEKPVEEVISINGVSLKNPRPIVYSTRIFDPMNEPATKRDIQNLRTLFEIHIRRNR